MRRAILTPGRVEDLIALILHLGRGRAASSYSKTLGDTLPNLRTPVLQIANEHPDLFRIGGEKNDSVSLRERFDRTDRPPLVDEQISNLISTVNLSYERAFKDRAHKFEIWKLIGSFFTGGVVVEVVRYLLHR